MSCSLQENDVNTKRMDLDVSTLLSTIGKWQIKQSKDLTEQEKSIIRDIDAKTYNKNDNDYIFDTYPCSFLLLCDENQDIQGGIMYWVTPYGKKISRSFSSDPKTYGRLVLIKKKQLFETRGWYGEQSGAPAYMLVTHPALNIQPIKDRAIVSTVVGDVTFAEDFDKSGKYTRYIEAIKRSEEKMLFGKPCMNGKKTSECEYECVGGAPKPNTKSYLVLRDDRIRRKVYIDKNGSKYIIFNKQRVLLSTLRGRYVYCN